MKATATKLVGATKKHEALVISKEADNRFTIYQSKPSKPFTKPIGEKEFRGYLSDINSADSGSDTDEMSMDGSRSGSGSGSDQDGDHRNELPDPPTTDPRHSQSFRLEELKRFCDELPDGPDKKRMRQALLCADVFWISMVIDLKALFRAPPTSTRACSCCGTQGVYVSTCGKSGGHICVKGIVHAPVFLASAPIEPVVIVVDNAPLASAPIDSAPIEPVINVDHGVDPSLTVGCSGNTEGDGTLASVCIASVLFHLTVSPPL